jgi:hypothetical protein
MAGLVPAIHAALPRRSLLPKKNVSYQMLILTGQCSRGQPWGKPGHDAFSPADALGCKSRQSLAENQKQS